MTRLVELREHGEPEARRLAESTVAGLMLAGLVDVVPERRGRTWLLKPKDKVGAVRVDDLEVRVTPKVPIERVVFMLAHAMGAVTWQGETVGVTRDADVVHVLAEAYLSAATRAVRPGLIQGYRLAEESLPVVRGRIRIDEQLKRRPGVWLPIEVSYDDFTVDTAENRILLAATERLLRNPLVAVETRRRLTAVSLRLAEVTRPVPGATRPAWRPTRLNLRYQPALRLAELVLDATSFEHRVGDVRIDGFVLNMWKVFEGFVTETLGTALVGIDPRTRVEPQYRGFLDEDGLVPMRPDVVWLDERNAPRAVIDAKYKAEWHSGFPNSDVYQALAYATALELPEAHLVYAKGEDPVTSHMIRGTHVVVHAHALDLALPPDALLVGVQSLASRIADQSRSLATVA